jgi:hypothetical protein
MNIKFSHFLFLICIWANISVANEVDHFTTKAMPLPDSTKAFNDWFNSSLDTAVKATNIIKKGNVFAPKGCSEDFLLENIHTTMNLDSWAAFEAELTTRHPEIPRIDLKRNNSIYADASSSEQPVLSLVDDLAPIVSINGVRLGTDKLGHFFSQGLILYRANKRRPESYKKGWKSFFGNLIGLTSRENQLAENRISREAHGVINGTPYNLKNVQAKKTAAVDALYDEDTGLGMKTNGVRSFADVAADYDGFNFWSEFYGKYVTCKDGKYSKAKDFDWKDWVSSAWDESINCSEYDEKFAVKINQRIKLLEKKLNMSLQCPMNKKACADLTLRYMEVYPYVLNSQCRNFSHIKMFEKPVMPNSCSE